MLEEEMTMVNFRIIKIMAVGLVLLFAAPAAAVEVYLIDSEHSSAIFKVKHVGISFVRGGFTEISGTILVDKENLENSSAEVVIKTASIESNVKKRDEHLRNEDFLYVEKYPEMTFRSTKVEVQSNESINVTGDFTLRGVTESISVEVFLIGEGETPWKDYRIGFETGFDIMRGDYGMKQLLPMVGDRVQITLVVEAIREE